MTIKKTSSRVIHASPETIMNLLSDVTSVDLWNPHVKKVDLVSKSPNQKEGLGAARVCHFFDNTSLKETVTESDTHHIRMVVTDYEIPMKTMNIEFRVEQRGGLDNKNAETSVLSFTMEYNVKYGLIGYLLGISLLKMKIHSVQSKILAGIDSYLTTGKPVEKDSPNKR